MKFSRERFINQARKGITLYIRLTLLLALVVSFGQGKWATLFVTVLALILTYAPNMAARHYKIELPVELEFIIVVFIYLSLFLGEVSLFYERFWWWDVLLHGTASLVLGMVGFMIMYVLYKGKKIRASIFLVSLMGFCFAVAMGALWEIFEFAVDNFLGMNMQKSGLVDTMWDLIVDALGALIVSVAGFFYLKGDKPPLFDWLIERFVDSNPKLFK